MDLFIFGLVLTLAFTSCLTDTSHTDIQVDPIDIVGKEWIQVDQWPSQDSSKDKIKFFYLFGDSQERIWKINNKPIDSINSQTFKLSFQYWQTTKDMFKIETYFFVDQIKYDLTSNYSHYEHDWMPFEKILSKDQMKKSYFHFRPGKGDSVLAVKNLRVDYQQSTPVPKLVASKDIVPGTDTFDNTLDLKSKCGYSLKTPNMKCFGNGFVNKSNTIISEVKDYSFDTSPKKDVCYNIEYLSKDIPTTVSVFYNSINDSTLSEIWRFKTKVESGDTPSTVRLCLSDFIAINSKRFYITFKFDQKNSEFVNNFFVKINAETQDFTDNASGLNFLAETKQDSTGVYQHQNQWQTIHPTVVTFKDEKEAIQIDGGTESYWETSARITSKWIKNDPELHNAPGKFKYTVDNEKMFHGIKIRPKVCDWLSHCTDVNIVSEVTDNNEKTISFEFISLNTTQLFKLVFDVIYYKPITEPGTFNFHIDLKFLSLGDPCDVEKVCNGGKCKSDPSKSVDQEGFVVCDCSGTNKRGLKCEIEDFCAIRTVKDGANQTTGEHYCFSLNKPNRHTCYPIKSTKDFACKCMTGTPPTTDETQLWKPSPDPNNAGSCDVINPSNNFWTNTSDSYEWTNKSTPLQYNYTSVSEGIKDICADISYSSTTLVQLSVDILVNNNKQNLFNNLILPTQSDDSTKISYCLKEFRRNIPENFILQYQISAINTKEAKKIVFKFESIQHKYKYEDQTVKNTFERKWDDTTDNQANWKTYPLSDKIKQEHNGFTLSDTITKSSDLNGNHVAWIASPWYIFSKDILNTTQFIVVYNKNSKFSLNIIYYYLDGSKGIVLTKPQLPQPLVLGHDAVPGGDPDHLRSNLTLKPDFPKGTSQFKAVFVFTYSTLKTDNNVIDITLHSVSLGDACAKYNPCKKPTGSTTDVTCKPTGPSTYTCDCPPKTLGQNCELVQCEDPVLDICLESPINFVSKHKGPERCKKTGTDFSCACQENYFKWDTTNKRCFRTTKYEPKNIPCNSGNCTLFESIPKEMSWANENMPQFNEVSSDKLDNSMPFIFSSKSGQSVSIQYKNVPRFYDTCLTLKYKINFGSSLLISYNDNTAFNLERRPTASQAKDNIDWTTRTICASQLTQSVASSFKINLKSQLGDGDVISVHVIESKLNFPTRERNLPFITFNQNDPALTKMAAYGNQWISHDDEWEEGTADINDIIFNAKYSGNKATEEITSYQISNWLPKNFDGLKVRFNVEVENTDPKIPFKLEVVVLDDKNIIKQTNTAFELKTTDTDTLPKTSPVNIPIIKQSSDFRVGLKVTYSGLNSDASKTLFTIQKLDIGDNCVEDNRDINECSSEGVCIRNYDNSKYTSKCKCNTDEYFGDKCQLVDFCKKEHSTTHGFISGNDFCSTNSYGNCTTGATEFKCDCNNNNDKFWSTANFECAPRPKCLTVKYDPSQECIEPTDPKDPTTFKCALGYINITANGKDALKCVKPDLCNTAHRKILVKDDPYLPEEACVDKKAKCDLTFDRNTPTCICPPGFDYDSTLGCVSQFCSSPNLNPCEQTCNPNNNTQGYVCTCGDDYDVSNNKCKLKSGKKCACKNNAYCDNSGNCQCIQGYKSGASGTNGQTDDCVINDDLTIDTALCPTGKLLKGKLNCDCGDHYTLDPKTGLCQLKDICVDTKQLGYQTCKNQSALCIPDINGGFSCVCKAGQIKDSDNNCIDYCEYKGRGIMCQDVNAICNPLITPNDHNDLDISNFCECAPGFLMITTGSTKKCVVAKYSVQFSLSVKDNILERPLSPPYSLRKMFGQLKKLRPKRSVYATWDTRDELGYAKFLNKSLTEKNQLDKDFEMAKEKSNVNKIILQTVQILLENSEYKNDKDTLKVIDCVLKGEYYTCSFTLSLKKKMEDYKKLQEAFNFQCVKIPGQDSCFFPLTTSFFNTNYLFVVINQKELNAKPPKPYKTCNKNTCNGHSLSNCIDDKDADSSLYSCRCGADFASTGAVVPLSAWPTGVDINKMSLESCSLIPYCGVKCKIDDPKKGDCVSGADQNDKGDWNAINDCRCFETFQLNSTNSMKHFCQDSCTNVNCHNGKTKHDRNGCRCVCEEKYSGEFCQDEYSPSKGGWIAGIVVLAVLVVIVAGIAFFFARRSRSNNDNSRSMNDFSGSSYRVPTGGQGGQRGQQNPSFHHE